MKLMWKKGTFLAVVLVIGLMLIPTSVVQGQGGYIPPSYQLPPPGPCWSCAWQQTYYTWNSPALNSTLGPNFNYYSTSPGANGVWITGYTWMYNAAPAIGAFGVPGYVYQQTQQYAYDNWFIAN